ncbi:hypothetical protein NC651_021749 [Populus alba x Populus x berolinensis]|nr:hypothetical protein NC651_021749 [Populus alba x Populus x berolinensis]
MSQPKIKRRVGKYEMGRTIGEGTFAKVKFARNSETGEPVALKILDKEKVLKHKMAEQIKREVATMKRIKHPNVVRLYEVMGSKTKIFIVLEYVTGGELFDKIVNHGRMREDEARGYFHQLINAVDYCHSRGVFHRDLKISAAEFTCPPWLSFGAMKLITRILDPNPMTRITVSEILVDEWFKKGYKTPVFEEKEDTNLDDVEAVFKDSEENHVTEKKEEEQPTAMNAFELISMSRGLNLGNLFDGEQQEFKRETRFTSKCPANEIIHKIEEAAKPLGFDVHKKNYKMRLENVKAGRKGNLNVATEIFQMAPSLHMVEVRKAKGDTLDSIKNFQPALTMSSGKPRRTCKNRSKSCSNFDADMASPVVSLLLMLGNTDDPRSLCCSEVLKCKNFLVGAFKPPCNVSINLADGRTRKQVPLKKENGQTVMVPLFQSQENIVGEVVIEPVQGKKVEHNGVKIELLGQIVRELDVPGELYERKAYPFEFSTVEMPYESYNGVNVRLRYILKVTISRNYVSKIVEYQDFVVRNYTPPPSINNSIKMEVGIEDCLHIEFEYSKSKYHLKDVIIGKIYFLMVRIKIKNMELEIRRRESTGSGPSTYVETETLSKFELMDGAPVRGESIPIRLFLSPYELTPTYRNVNNKFSVKYYLNLVLVDEEDRRYFKQQEITVYRLLPTP